MVMKKCQIHAISPITCFTVPIVGTTQLNLTPDEIYNCLCAKAEVMEILANGKMINLDFTNYNRDNSIIGEPMEEVKEEPVETVFVTGLSTELDATVAEVAETTCTENEEVEVEDSVEVKEETEQEEEPIVEESTEEAESVEPVKDMKVEARNNNYKNNNKKNKNRK